jgi:TonB family protein
VIGWRIMRKTITSLCVVLAFAPVAARADATYLRTVGGWEIYQETDSCYMAMEYEGPGETLLAFMKNANGTLFLSATNSGWSAEEKKTYDISYELNGTSYSGGKSFGMKNSYRKGFVTTFDPSFEADFRQGSSLWIYLGDTKIDQLSLKGTGIAMDAVNSCLVRVKAAIAAEAKEKARWEHIPKDPFADAGEATDAPTEKKRDPVPRHILSLATTSDYPSAALREEREGRTTFELTVGADGRPIKCDITQSSGHADLDAATCNGAMRRGRFNPALNDNGQPVEGKWSSSVNWAIPK